MPKSNHTNVPSFKIISIRYQELFVIWFADTDTWVNQMLSVSCFHAFMFFCCDLITTSCPDVWAPFQILSLNIWTCVNTCNGDCPALKLNFYNPWYHFAMFFSESGPVRASQVPQPTLWQLGNLTSESQLPAFAYPGLWSRSYRPPSLCLF